MPRYPRFESPTKVYHFINRGVNKKKLFHRPEDFRFYKDLIFEYKERFRIDIYHYCLMINHTHLLLRAEEAVLLSRFAHFIQRRYAYYYCKTYHWSEQVFRKRFISISVENDGQFLECGRYIERNPLDAKLVEKIEDYPHTSYPHYAHNKPDFLVTLSPLFDTLGRSLEERRAVYYFYVNQVRNYEIPGPVKEELATF